MSGSRLATWMDRRRRHRRNADPPPPPVGWVVAPPDFVGLGAEKAGTSWWFELLVDHPEIVRPPSGRKELRYFNRFGDTAAQPADLDRYRRLFPRPPGCRSGEWTPSYLVDFWVPALLARAAPEAKLLVLLRDPVTRFASGLREAAARGRPVGVSQRRAAFERGCYASQIERVHAWFPPEQLLVLQYEACARDPLPHLARTYRFLGVDPGHRPADPHRPVHRRTERSSDPADPPRHDLALAYRGELARLVDLVPGLDLTLWPSAAVLDI